MDIFTVIKNIFFDHFKITINFLNHNNLSFWLEIIKN
jgi:hypothetical protein